MKNRRLLFSASLLLIVLLLIPLCIHLKGVITGTSPGNSADDHWGSDDTEKQTDPGASDTAGQRPSDDSGDWLDPDSATVSLNESIVVPDKDGDDYQPDAEESNAEIPTPTKDEFFSDALFIGDSRTVGLEDYAELETATFFAYSGLSSFSAFKKSLDVEGVGKVTLDELLTSQHYQKIYLMLGINELGYPLSSIRSQYTHVANRIHELQPHARIILCANLRVVADGTEKRDYVANDTINQVNEHIASLADNETFFYVDVNPLFDDGNGALDPQYCADDIHPYGKYYYQWAEWLYEVGTQANKRGAVKK